MGRIRHGRSDYDGALRFFGRALALAPGDAELYRARAETWEAMGEPSKAVADRNRAARIESGGAIEDK
jgi:hypothetical protein